jgi:hypothetical protein
LKTRSPWECCEIAREFRAGTYGRDYIGRGFRNTPPAVRRLEGVVEAFGMGAPQLSRGVPSKDDASAMDQE